MSEEFFEINDEVMFETDPYGIGPRWMLNYDQGYSGIWATGIVTSVEKTCIRIDALFPDGDVRPVSWPNYGSSDFEPDQWMYPGYLQKLDGPGPECDCGCGKDDKNGHWKFCQRYGWLTNA